MNKNDSLVLAGFSLSIFAVWAVFSFSEQIQLLGNVVIYGLILVVIVVFICTCILCFGYLVFRYKSWQTELNLQKEQVRQIRLDNRLKSIKARRALMTPVVQKVLPSGASLAIDYNYPVMLHRSPETLSNPLQQPLIEVLNDTPCLIDKMLKIDRMVLIGGTGTGKTNVLKHYVSALIAQGKKLTIIDPHSPCKILNQDVIGAGLDFDMIRDSFTNIMLDISKAYATGNIAQDGDMGIQNRYIIVEEFYDIQNQLGELAVEFLKTMLIRGRKAGVKFCLVSQADSVAALGLKGDTGLLEGAEKIELTLDGRTEQRRATVGRKRANQYECKVPKLFTNYPTVSPENLILTQPRRYSETERKLALAIASLNGAAKSTSKADIYKLAGVSKNSKNGNFIDLIR